MRRPAASLVALLLGGATLVAVGEVLDLMHARRCESAVASACWAGALPQVPLVMGLVAMIAASCLGTEPRPLRWWDAPAVALLALAIAATAIEASDLINPGDNAWDGRNGPTNVLIWTLAPLCVVLTYFTLRLRSPAAIPAALLTFALPVVLLFVGVLLSGGSN